VRYFVGIFGDIGDMVEAFTEFPRYHIRSSYSILEAFEWARTWKTRIAYEIPSDSLQQKEQSFGLVTYFSWMFDCAIGFISGRLSVENAREC
jgi:hypothetical protein